MNKFRIYNEGGDTQVFVSSINGKETKEKNEFVFRSFSNKLHPYFVKQMKWIQEILNSSGIILNINTVKTVHDMSVGTDEFFDYLEDNTIKLSGVLDKSSDGNTYYLIQDEEMGRGWAALIKIDSENKIEFLMQDHRDNVRDKLLQGDFIRNFGIDYKEESVENLSEI